MLDFLRRWEFDKGFHSLHLPGKVWDLARTPFTLFPSSSPNAALRPRRPRTEVRAGRPDPSLSSAMPRHGAILSLLGMVGRGGEEGGHLEKMAMSNGAVFFLSGGLWDGAAESVTV